MSFSEGVLIALISAGLPILGLLIKSRWDRRSKRQDKEQDIVLAKESNSVTRLDRLIDGLQEQLNSQRSEIRFLKSENLLLLSRVNSLSSGIMSMSVFGKNSPMAMWIKTLDGRRVMHNRTYEEMIGIGYMDISGMTDYEIMISAYKNPTPDQEAEVRRITDQWGANDDIARYGVDGDLELVDLEMAFHVDRPSDVFPVLSVKWMEKYNGEPLIKCGMAVPFRRLDKAIDAYLKVKTGEVDMPSVHH